MGWLATGRSRRSSWWVPPPEAAGLLCLLPGAAGPHDKPGAWGQLAVVGAHADLDLWPQDFERDEERSANGGSESDGEENIGWSTVNLDEEKQQQDVRMGKGYGLDMVGDCALRDLGQVAWCPRASVTSSIEWALKLQGLAGN